MLGSKVAVIMSVYEKDTVEYLKESIESILNQSYQDLMFFIQVDGVVSVEIANLLEFYSSDQRVVVTFHEVNLGLAHRLNDAIDQVLHYGGFDFVARMDADDISVNNRIELQVQYLTGHQDIDVLGTDVIEIDESGNELFYKRMHGTHKALSENIIKRCPFNHPTVVFKVDVFKEGFRYNSDLMNTQDYYFWVDLLAAGKRFANINEALLYFRLDSTFHARRGLKKANNDLFSRVYALKKLRNMTLTNCLHLILLYILRLSPKFIKKFAYNNFR
ncbi:glycosyltransferase [Vibrio sp. SCSIO 43140]|uniref:glycosyltransferase n=1 Tax=Vibrio sp. SCSIO 43140 TaxID=2819100 RepID=UPI0020761C21|nr:glycosyltransferase [Vibrio sp. SCSIO 43140]USD60279.1 glycosyltransferase [Vibrio sp. SCSIO 43140]